MSAKCQRCLQFPGRRTGASGFTLDLCTCVLLSASLSMWPLRFLLSLCLQELFLCPPARLCQHFPSMMLSLHYWPSWSWKQGFVSQKVRAERYKSIMIHNCKGAWRVSRTIGKGRRTKIMWAGIPAQTENSCLCPSPGQDIWHRNSTQCALKR